MKYMIMTNLYMGSHVTNERFLSKDQVIAELKSRIDCLENEKVRRCNENINRMSENMQLHQELEEAQEEISYLKHELKISKKYIDFWEDNYSESRKEIEQLKEQFASTETGKLEERVKQLEEERDHYQLLCDQIEFELRQAKDASAAMDLFKNCDSMESLSKRKKTLLSIFHPDNEYGDNEITRMILAQYNKKKESICK